MSKATHGNSNRKKVAALAGLMALSAGLVPQNSHALIIGTLVGTGAAAAAVLGISETAAYATLGAGVVGGTALFADPYFWTQAVNYLTFKYSLGAELFVGVFVLADPQNSFSFVPATSEQADKLGLSFEETNAYNSELEQINAIRQEVELQIAQGKPSDAAQAMQISRDAWEKYGTLLSPEAFQAVQKISRAAAQKASS